MKSYKSFEELVQEEPPIEKILPHFDQYHAHTHTSKPFEKLHEHVHLVMEYANKLVEAHRLDAVLDNLISDLLSSIPQTEQSEIVGNFIKKLFVNALIYHDYGKVNENFQIEKMRNEGFFSPNEHNKIGSQHSILSAFIYLTQHLNTVIQYPDLPGNEKNFLLGSTLLFSSPIVKHHAGFFEYQLEFDEEKVSALEPYLGLFQLGLSWEVEQSLLMAEKLMKCFSKKFLQEETVSFAFFALLKLNFSLLTAADYYATNDFMGNMPIHDFGIMNDNFKEQLYDNFVHNPRAPYNGELMSRMSFYNQLEFSQLQTRNNQNLNLLRQKMAAEAITCLRSHIDDRLFYLEAPTGGGKTNMSFACALELLQSDKTLNKVFYVFPFTTLITQTFNNIRETLQIGPEAVIQLHAKGGFHTTRKEEVQDGLYGSKKLNYINNLFINYPFTLLSHIKFFDILKGNGKDTNYILHRLSNAVVIIDELQAYTPKHWDKIIFFIHHYARQFNMRVIIMSATLPKIDKLNKRAKGK
ncbi:MAG: CRISPR-associated endonuclease Cas3'', partial [Bacteroidetes bacterium]